MDEGKIFFGFLKKKHYVVGDIDALKKEAQTSSVKLRNPKDLFIRDAITGMGTILLEDLEKHYYITTVRVGIVGNVLAYAMILRNEEYAEIITYAREGLIKQHLAQKALEKVIKVLE